MARRLVRRAMEIARGDLRQIDFAHVERILEMARFPDGHDRFQLPGLDMTRSFDWIRLRSPDNAAREPADFSFALEAPGSVELPGSRTRITLQVLEKGDPAQACATVVNELDWQRFRTGERAQPGAA